MVDSKHLNQLIGLVQLVQPMQTVASVEPVGLVALVQAFQLVQNSFGDIFLAWPEPELLCSLVSGYPCQCLVSGTSR